MMAEPSKEEDVLGKHTEEHDEALGKEEEGIEVSADLKDSSESKVDDKQKDVAAGKNMVDIELGSAMLEIRKDPPLYVEAYDMLEEAFLMFCLPDLRKMAKEGLFQGDPEMIQRCVDLPASLFDICTVFA